MREQFQRSRQDVMDRAAAEGLDADAFWGEAAALLSGSPQPAMEEPIGDERAQQERSRAQHGMTDTRRMLEEDELMRKVARGAAPPPTGGT